MSIRSKDLAYESNEPSFLRKLKSQYGGDSDRHERPIARPRKERADNADEDDAPTYVDEASHDTITKEEFEKMANPEAQGQPDEEDVSKVADKDVEPKNASPAIAPRKAVEASIGNKKRRLAKTVDTADDTGAAETSEEPPKKTTKKAGKKAQKIKLSFGDDED